jgi:hypothetical protein
MGKIAASLINLGGAIGQAFVQSASGNHAQYSGSGAKRKVKKTCSPCEAMARVDAARARVRNVGK